MLSLAAHAIHAAHHRRSWGRFAARRYCERRGVPLRLYFLACRLEAQDRARAEMCTRAL